MIRRAVALLVFAVGCATTPEPPSASSRAEDLADNRLEERLSTPLVSDAKFKAGASLEVVLATIADEARLSYALDPRLEYSHGPATFELRSSSGSVRSVLQSLEAIVPELHIAPWRGTVFVSKAGDPLFTPQSPLLSYDAKAQRVAPITVRFSHTPLSEVAQHLAAQVPWGQRYAVRFDAAPEIKNRRVTAAFRELPLVHALDVICRLTGSKVILDHSKVPEVHVFTPCEPVAPDSRDR